MKALIAHIIVTYDFKLEEGKVVPAERHFGLFRAPGDADVLFRERRKWMCVCYVVLQFWYF